jgi:hypothetical protein
MKIKALEEELIEYLGDWGWAAFESTEDGHIRLDDNPKKYPYDFYMRVGLHMKRPMQVIVSYGKYIRMRSAEQWAAFPLNDIDPANPETTLYADDNSRDQYYQMYQAGIPIGNCMWPKRTWRPIMPMPNAG